jgi:hypothetical protein
MNKTNAKNLQIISQLNFEDQEALREQKLSKLKKWEDFRTRRQHMVNDFIECRKSILIKRLWLY